MLIPYDSKALMGGGDSISTSPFTLVFKNAGLAFAASFMNAVIHQYYQPEIQECTRLLVCYIQ